MPTPVIANHLVVFSAVGDKPTKAEGQNTRPATEEPMWRNRAIPIWLIVIVVLLGLSTARFIFPTVEAGTKTYKVDRVDTVDDFMPSSAMEKLLNQRSHEGWELVSTASSQRDGNTVVIALIFKR